MMSAAFEFIGMVVVTAGAAMGLLYGAVSIWVRWDRWRTRR